MIDRGLRNGSATTVDVRPFQRKTTEVLRLISRPNHPWFLSPEQEAFLRDRFSTRLEDPNTGRRIK